MWTGGSGSTKSLMKTESASSSVVEYYLAMVGVPSSSLGWRSKYAAVIQLVECQLPKLNAPSSSLGCRTTFMSSKSAVNQGYEMVYSTMSS